MRKQRHYRGGYDFTGLAQARARASKTRDKSRDVLWQLLRDRKLLGFKFRCQHQIGRYIADFYCREAQLVIECDGAIHDRNEQWQHDQARDAMSLNKVFA